MGAPSFSPYRCFPELLEHLTSKQQPVSWPGDCRVESEITGPIRNGLSRPLLLAHTALASSFFDYPASVHCYRVTTDECERSTMVAVHL
jgi:hypothetical protein